MSFQEFFESERVEQEARRIAREAERAANIAKAFRHLRQQLSVLEAKRRNLTPPAVKIIEPKVER